MKIDKNPSSFRDPSGFVFSDQNTILRQISTYYKKNYQLLKSSGLYEKLVEAKLLIPHSEVPDTFNFPETYKIIKPLKIPFISYPYEWCFSQLKDAALLTLHIQKKALQFGMSLKDATPYNIQFLEGKPILMDTLSFEKYEEGKPWVPYRQFCEQFLAPLSLMAYTNITLGKLTQEYVSGIPLDLTEQLLPLPSKLNPLVLIHLLLHGKSQKNYTRISKKQKEDHAFSRNALSGLIDSLYNGIKGLHPKSVKTVWTHYYEDYHPSYTKKSRTEKKEFVEKYLKINRPGNLCDIGANTGEYSQIAAKNGIVTLSLDNDPTAVEQNYNRIQQNGEKNILPLWIDILNPSPSIGWQNTERSSFLSRLQPDAILALALIHHLAITNNVPLSFLADFFSRHCRLLIIEFIPKSDPQVQKLLQNRKDIFIDYDQNSFEKEFSRYFKTREKLPLSACSRIMYCMENKGTV